MFCQAFDKAKRNTPMYFPQNNHTKKFELCLLHKKKKERQNSFVGRLLVLIPSAKSESKSRPFGVARFSQVPQPTCFQEQVSRRTWLGKVLLSVVSQLLAKMVPESWWRQVLAQPRSSCPPPHLPWCLLDPRTYALTLTKRLTFEMKAFGSLLLY